MSETRTYEEIVNNEEFQEILSNARTEADIQAAFAAVGIDASADDIAGLGQAIQSEAMDETLGSDSDTLSEEDLDNVSGGVIDWVVAISTGYKIGKKVGNAIYKYGRKRGWFN